MMVEKKLKRIRSRAGAWKECLALWKKLSETPDCAIVPRSAMEFKNSVLNDLGYGDCKMGCPFCQYFVGCKDCPLMKEFGGCVTRPCPYVKWLRTVGHNQEYAKACYDCLRELHEKEVKGA